MILDTTFEASALEAYLDSLGPEEMAVATELLTLAESQEELERALERDVHVDLDGLPNYMDHSNVAQRLCREGEIKSMDALLQEFDADDPLGMYLQELAAIPVCGDPEVLALQMTRGDTAAGEMLMNMSLGRVAELALSYTGHGVLLMDLIQEGNIGLLEAIGSFEDGRFTPIRDKKICYAMEKCVVLQAYAAGVGEKLRQVFKDFMDMDQKLLTDLGRNPTREEIGEALHLEPAETEAVAEMLEATRSMARVQPREPEEQEAEEDQAVEDTAYFQMRQRILDMLSSLSEQESKLLTMRYGLDGKKPMTAREAGARLGLTAQQTVALEASALEKLRKQ